MGVSIDGASYDPLGAYRTCHGRSTLRVVRSLEPRSRVVAWAAALLVLFAFRLLFGVTRELFFEDQTQIFLMGLRYYATGAWPFFGADVVWTKSEIPGALQALLVGVPLRLVPIPESPYGFVALLSMGSLSAFAWYVTRRLPQLPAWLVWGWLMTLPWTLEMANHIINPSYLLAPAVWFFLGFFEAVPVFRLGTISRPVAFALMGLAVAWVMQIHMSWPLLLPFAAFAWISGRARGGRGLLTSALAFVAGFLPVGALLLPTLVVYGMNGGSGGTLRNIRIHAVSPVVLAETLARVFSFASLEIWRFMATDDGKRLMFLLRHLWIAPLALVVWFAGVWQPIWMLREWFRRESPFPEWRPLKMLVVGTVVLIYASYWVVLEPPQAHAFYVIAPVGLMFAAYCWTFVDSARWRRAAAIVLTINVLYHAGQAWIHAPEHSLYRNREVVASAVRLKEPEMFGHRRAFAVDGGPAMLQREDRPWDVQRDVRFSDVRFTVGPRSVVLWTVRLTLTNPRVAFRDVLYRTRYHDASGTIVEEHADYVKDVFQPGTDQLIEINDGLVRAPFVSATIEMLGAEALLPIPSGS